MTGLILFLHARLAVAAILFALLLGVWGSYQYIRHKAISPGFRSSYLLLCGLIAVQSLLGLLTLLTGSKLHSWLHIVYGIFAVVFLPGLYFYSVSGRQTSKAREAVLLAAACWIVLVALGRGWITGQ